MRKKNQPSIKAPAAKIFGAYDIRGRYPRDINLSAVAVIARALSRDWRGQTVVLGRDIRHGSVEISSGIKSELESGGVMVIDGGLMTTPMLYFLVCETKASGGIMVTASHNPKNWNGLKMVGSGAIPIRGEEVYQKVKKL